MWKETVTVSFFSSLDVLTYLQTVKNKILYFFAMYVVLSSC